MAVIFAASTLLLAGCCSTPPATKWEYKVALVPGLLETDTVDTRRALREKFLNDLGKEGWVLVMAGVETGNMLYFKRRNRSRLKRIILEELLSVVA